MSYCLNPTCPEPINTIQAKICEACGNELLLGDRYQLLRYIGKGGFGRTFLAADLSSPEQSLGVMKQLRSKRQKSSTGKKLFEREARILGEIGNHPQIPSLIDYFEDRGQFFLIQEYIFGQNLKQEIKQHGTLSESQTKQALKEILLILKYVHSHQIIHRDIKPSNILLRHSDRKLVLIDFGLVEDQADNLSPNQGEERIFSEHSVGTRGFAPPEQIALQPVYASDIYSLGVTCIYLMTGKTPEKIGLDPMTGEVMWFKNIQVSPSFAKILLTMLEIAVEDRYQTAGDVLQALENID